MVNKKLWNTTYGYLVNGVHLSVYLFHTEKFFFVVNKRGLRGMRAKNLSIINCSPRDGNDFPSQGLQLIMQGFFAQEPQVRGY